MPQNRRWLPLASTLLFLAGCGHSSPSPLAPPAAPPATFSAAAQPPVPPGVPTAEASGALPGTRTCVELNAAVSQASLMEPGVVDHIVAASSTADAPVADAARRLAAAYAKATTSKGTSQEPDAVAAVSAAAADMAGVCAESGLESAG
ncbi:hypothetical protein [Actinoplanes sp. NPDC051411]|uniref:hypothetical protein n=1 Tax=Actinoplanes sp. NPDC051411 TaxID=3155522 RepID=UPI0034497708